MHVGRRCSNNFQTCCMLSEVNEKCFLETLTDYPNQARKKTKNIKISSLWPANTESEICMQCWSHRNSSCLVHASQIRATSHNQKITMRSAFISDITSYSGVFSFEQISSIHLTHCILWKFSYCCATAICLQFFTEISPLQNSSTTVLTTSPMKCQR